MSQKYNRIMPESEGNVFCVEIADKVTLADYERLIGASAQELFATYKKLNIVLSYLAPFPGWDLDAAARDLELMTQFGRSLNKVALVNPPEQVLIRWQAMKPLLGGELRFFTDVNEAIIWAKS